MICSRKNADDLEKKEKQEDVEWSEDLEVPDGGWGWLVVLGVSVSNVSYQLVQHLPYRLERFLRDNNIKKQTILLLKCIC